MRISFTYFKFIVFLSYIKLKRIDLLRMNNRQKHNIIRRLFTSTFKLNPDIGNRRSQSPLDTFNYELPKSFLNAVNDARLTAGYDMLPRRLHRRSFSSTVEQNTSSSSLFSVNVLQRGEQARTNIRHSASANDIGKVSTKKVQFRRKPREHVHHSHLLKPPLLFSPRQPFRMINDPNFLMINRFQRSRTLIPIRPTLFPQQRHISRFRF